jgi:hypothetical protein
MSTTSHPFSCRKSRIEEPRVRLSQLALRREDYARANVCNRRNNEGKQSRASAIPEWGIASLLKGIEPLPGTFSTPKVCNI